MTTAQSPPVRIGFALEYNLGHVTHAENLKRAIADGIAGIERRIEPLYVDLPFAETPVGAWANLPPVRSNWSVRASLGAYRGLRPHIRHLDALFFHTQVTSLFSAGLMRRVPSVVSLDATPVQYDSLGEFYGHTPGMGKIEDLKRAMNVRAFGAARHLVTWAEWTKGSLVRDYGVPADKVTVIPPGIDTAKWDFGASRAAKPDDAPVDLLFVGADFARKGGETLLAAFDGLAPNVRDRARLHIVTRTEGIGGGRENVRVYHGVTPNSDTLLSLFRQADAFVFPTRGDCLPLAIMEALAAGLPVVTTAVGALPEAVTDGETGLVVPPDDAPAMARAMTALIEDGALRRRLGAEARRAAVARFDAATNYASLVNLIAAQANPSSAR